LDRLLGEFERLDIGADECAEFEVKDVWSSVKAPKDPSSALRDGVRRRNPAVRLVVRRGRFFLLWRDETEATEPQPLAA
jgi:hypothetical protein